MANDSPVDETSRSLPVPRHRRAPGVAAFFDMDKTLISENSSSLYMKHRYRQGEVDAWDLARGLGAYLRYKLGILDIRAWTTEVMKEFRDRLESELESQAREFFDRWIVRCIYPQAEEAIRWHQSRGDVVAIVSGATRYVVEPLATHLGVEHSIYTRVEVENGRLTGRVVDPVCFEEGKIYWLGQFIEEHEIDLAKSWFYTDSVTDLPLLDLVGHPVVTNPDPMLYRAAVRRRWPVRFFEVPPQAETSTDVGAEIA